MLTASIVTYCHNYKDISLLINALIASAEVQTVYVIDNSPNDYLKILANDGDKIVYIFNHKNIGYGSGHNIALRKAMEAGADYHIVINPDVYFKNGCIKTLRTFMDQHDDIGLLMPKVLYPNGKLQYLCKLIPSPFDLFGRRFVPFRKLIEKKDYKNEMRFSGYDKVMDVPFLSGCFMLIRLRVLKQTGLFDERFFMYLEDVDLCRRIGEKSRTVFCPEAAIYHEYSKGSYRNLRLLNYHIHSAIKYFNKWGWLFDKKRNTINAKAIEKIHAML